MLWACLALLAAGFAVSLIGTWSARAAGRRLRALDSAGVKGQIKEPPRSVPNTGGAGVFLGIALPMFAIVAASRLGLLHSWFGSIDSIARHLPGLASKTAAAGWVIAGAGVLHVMGLLDDRRPLRAGSKLITMLAVTLFIVWKTDTRLLTMLDEHAGGSWLSIALTVLWIVAVINAINFIDNMDGLCAGVVAVCGGFFLAAALLNEQWFVAGFLALVVGAACGFLVFNFPPATIFMGDSGSLVLGFLLGFLTVRTTYQTDSLGGGWYAVLMPIVVLAVPMYDFLSVTFIRLRQGKSPFVGDLQHLSHRLVRHGLSKRAAVAVIWGFTAITAIGGVSLGSLNAWQALLVGIQTVLLLLVLAVFEWRTTARRDTPTPPPPAAHPRLPHDGDRA